MDVLDDDDGVIDHEADREHQRQQREQVDREPHQQHQERAADEGQGHGQRRHDGGAHGTQRQVDDEQYDKQGFDEGDEHLPDRILDIDTGIVAHFYREHGRQLCLDVLYFVANLSCDG